MKIEVREGYPEVDILIRCPQDGPAIQRIVSLLASLDQHLRGLKDGQTHVIDWPDVLYLESVDKRTFIYTAQAVYETPLKLYEAEERFDMTSFFRSSKSQIVNVARIASLRPEFGARLELTMDNGERLLVSRTYAKALKERLGLL